ncbi:MAG: sulfatase-like hydrolase/transferase, partial [Vicinamibacteria bacterium]
VCDRDDDCSELANPDQSDADLDGIGDACDADYDQDGRVGASDFNLLRQAWASISIDARYRLALDSDSDGSVGRDDLRALQRRFGRAPGPSGLGCAGSVPCTPSDAEPLPNIVLIISDDQGYRDFGFMGSRVIQTPNLDRLAEQGVVFSTGYSTETICRPVLRSLLTGLYPHQWTDRVSALQSRGVQREEWGEVLDFQTLPRLLAQRGYASFESGKYWEGTFDMGGFDRGMSAVLDRSFGGMAGGEGLAIGRTTMEPVFEFLEQQVDRPFLLWFAPLLPHLPHDPPPEALARYEGLGLPAPVQRYYGNISRLDDAVGLLVAKLEELGLRERTLIAFIVDNGWDQPQTDLPEDWRGGLGGPKGKATLFDLGFRTPIVLNWRGHVPEGVVLPQPVSAVDLFATLLGYAGIRPSSHRDGVDLRPRIEGRDPAAVRAAIVGPSNFNFLFLRDERWHYV